ncbi:alpha/beta fold hydrolase [Corynebacterium vitaeruminis]|uniref:alpha/beta fold hydrolase n=1 Tax=Corynebacterium vitaeruminis TaxID=38305 RepID=UPI0028A91C3E|nr:alpha/beta fold hydrolase [Corynebacterium vitaeruminis]
MILHHIERGQGTPVVLLGSIASDAHMWDPQIEALSRTHRVIALDHRGHGASPDPEVAPGATTIDELARDVLDTLDSLGVGDFAVAGLSLGGAVAQHLAATSGRVTRAAFLCTAPYFGGAEKWAPRAALTRAEGMAPMAEAIFSLWVTPENAAAQPEAAELFRNMIADTRGAGYASCADALAGWDVRERLHEIAVPVLTIAGEQDQSTPPAVVHGIAQGAAGPAQSVTVPGAHVPTFESAELINDALVAFFS